MSHAASQLHSYRQKLWDTYFYPFSDKKAKKYVGTCPEGIDTEEWDFVVKRWLSEHYWKKANKNNNNRKNNPDLKYRGGN